MILLHRKILYCILVFVVGLDEACAGECWIRGYLLVLLIL